MPLHRLITLLVVTIAALLNHAAAESYQAWLGESKSSPISLHFSNLSGSEVSLDRPFERVLELSSGPYIGNVRIEGETAGLRYPLEFEIANSDLSDSDIVFGQNEIARGLRDDAEVTPPISIETYRIESGERSAIPIVCPESHNSRFISRNIYTNCRIEVRDSTGAILGRRMMYGVINRSGQSEQGFGWAIGDSLGERILKNAGRVAGTQTLESLPYSPHIGLDVDTIWISPKTADILAADGERARNLLRHLVLAGSWIVAPDGADSKLAAAAGVDLGKPIFFGGIGNHDATSLLSLLRVHGARITRANDTTQNYLKKNPNFGDYSSTYFGWSVGFAAIYAALIVIGIPALFLGLKGRTRMRIWVIAPGACFLCTAAIWLTGKALFPTKTLIEITEVNYSFAPWQQVETFSEANVLNLGFRTSNFEIPFQAGFTATPDYMNRSLRSSAVKRTSGSTSITMTAAERGRPIRFETRHSNPAPEVPLIRGGLGQICAVRDISAVRALDLSGKDQRWRLLGPLKKGECVNGETPRQRDVQASELGTALFNLSTLGTSQNSYYNSSNDSVETQLAISTMRSKIHEDGLYPGALLISARTEDLPALRPLGSNFDVVSEVIWNILFPPMSADAN